MTWWTEKSSHSRAGWAAAGLIFAAATMAGQVLAHWNTHGDRLADVALLVAIAGFLYGAVFLLIARRKLKPKTAGD